MPRSITQYRVFIASPGGLKEEREGFRDLLEKYNKLHAEPRGVIFAPVGWEDTIGGVGRPQELINEDLKQCDYAVFVLHDRWGSPTGTGHSSGTEEEWELAEQLYAETKIRNIALFFKDVDERQLRDPGDQLRKVIAFKQQIEAGKKYLCKSVSTADAFCDGLEAHLAKWFRDHESASTASSGLRGAISLSDVAAGMVSTTPPAAISPNFEFWIEQTNKLFGGEQASIDYAGILFCAKRALAAAGSESEWARAKNAMGVVHFYLNQLTDALAAFTAIAQRFESASGVDARTWVAKALVNEALTLGQLSRSEDAIAAYGDVIARFGTASEPALREQVARALVNKGVTLGALNGSEDAIAAYDDVIARFGTASEPALREQVANALFNKGVRLGALNRSEDAIAVYDDVIARFGTASEPALREQVARALVNKGVTLGALDRSEDAIAVYDDVIARFGTASEPALREQVANALFNKGVTLGALNRGEEEIAVYDDVIARFGACDAPSLKDVVEMARERKDGLSLHGPKGEGSRREGSEKVR